MKTQILKLLLLLFAYSASVTCEDGDCTLPLPRFRFFMPLIFSPNGTLLHTESKNEHFHNITVAAGDRVILSCSPNYFKTSVPRTKIIRASCKGIETLVVNGEEKNWLKDLTCEMRTIEEIITPVVGCSDELQSVEFGYASPIKEKSLVLGEACYSTEEGRTHFVHVKIPGANNRHVVALKTEDLNYLTQKHPDSKYKIDYLMAARMDELNVRLANTLSTPKIPFFEPRHFVDFAMLPNGQLYSILKLGWNFVTTNGYDHLPNWDLLHMDIMNLTGRSYDLYMGTHGILSLKNAQGATVDIYLRGDEKMYPVPKYLWSAVTSEDDGKAVAFVISNDIDANEEHLQKDSICESKCEQITWLTNLMHKNSHKKTKNGYVWCCDMENFLETINEMPAIEGKYKLLA